MKCCYGNSLWHFQLGQKDVARPCQGQTAKGARADHFQLSLFQRKKIKIIYQTFNFDSSNPDSQLWLQSYASVIILWNLCISIYQFMNFNFTVVRSMSNAKPSHRVYHNPLQWNFWSRWCNISACNSSEFPHGFPDFRILYIITFLPPIFVISIFCNLIYFRLQFSRFPYSATYHVIFVCRLPGFHKLQLVRFLPVFF